MIRSCCQQDQVISFDTPLIQQTLEVRPKIRNVSGPPAPVLTPPVPVAVTELKPVTKANSPAPPDPDPRPTQTAVIELKPVIKDVEEE
jgi:hypothetical protein